jgi:hypothetical protein
MAVRVGDLVAKLTVNVSMHRVVNYVIGYIVHSSYSLRASAVTFFLLVRIWKDHHSL